MVKSASKPYEISASSSYLRSATGVNHFTHQGVGGSAHAGLAGAVDEDEAAKVFSYLKEMGDLAELTEGEEPPQ